MSILKADEDVWEFKDKMQCEFHAVLTGIALRIVNAVTNVELVHYATVEHIFEMLEDDTLQRFVDIYGGRECYIKLYKAMHDMYVRCGGVVSTSLLVGTFGGVCADRLRFSGRRRLINHWS